MPYLRELPSVCTGWMINDMKYVRKNGTEIKELLKKAMKPLASNEYNEWNPRKYIGRGGIVSAVTTIGMRNAASQLKALGFQCSPQSYPSRHHRTKTILWWHGIQELRKQFEEEDKKRSEALQQSRRLV